MSKMLDGISYYIKQRMRQIKKIFGIRIGLFIRGWGYHLLSESKSVQNVYHACVQKTGSQWIKAVFSDPDIIKESGLRIHPQFRYEVGEFKHNFPRYTFVPGLYMSYTLYREINKPDQYRTFYVIRDPRDVVVSWYYSMKYTHRLIGNVSKHRNMLKGISESDGISYCIRELRLKFSFMRTWWDNRDDPLVHIVRFEDLIENPIDAYRKIFDHCEIDIDGRTLKAVLDRYTKDKMRNRDLKKRRSNRSHYRKKGKRWSEMFKDEHVELFYRINGDLLELLGYE